MKVKNSENIDVDKRGLLDYDIGTKSKTSGWTHKHTIAVLVIRLLIEFLYRNAFLFYNDYAQSLNISDTQFGYILIFSEMGAFGAIIFNSTNTFNCNSNEAEQNLIVHSIVAGIISILFTLPQFISFGNNAWGIILFCGICRFFIGLSFVFLSATTLRFVV